MKTIGIKTQSSHQHLHSLCPRAKQYFTKHYLVVDVEVSFSGVLGDDSAFLKQEVRDLSSIRCSSSAELYLKVFSLGGKHRGLFEQKSTRVKYCFIVMFFSTRFLSHCVVMVCSRGISLLVFSTGVLILLKPFLTTKL